jgi:hypothetical protein
MGTVEAVVAFLRALPDILRVLAKLGEWISRQETKSFFAELEGNIDVLSKATTRQQRVRAGRALLNTISKL